MTEIEGMIEVGIEEVVIEMGVEDLIVMSPQENEEVTTEVKFDIYIEIFNTYNSMFNMN